MTLPNHKRIEPIPGHALHEKGLQGRISTGTPFSSQERRALSDPRIKRWLGAGLFLYRYI